MSQQQIQVIIVHPSRLCRESIALVLAQQPAMAVVAVDAELPQTDTEFTSLTPAVFVLDFGGARRSGLDDAQRIHRLSPKCRILVINVPLNDTDILACIECGASGYLLDDASADDLVANIQAISAGETLCSPRIANLAFDKLSQLAHQSQMIHGDHATPLTRRELEIIAAIEKGWSNKEIALGLHIEVSTVKNHIHNILEKLELRDRRSAARYVKEHGITASLS